MLNARMCKLATWTILAFSAIDMILPSIAMAQDGANRAPSPAPQKRSVDDCFELVTQQH
jgi:hypothetical protein